MRGNRSDEVSNTKKRGEFPTFDRSSLVDKICGYLRTAIYRMEIDAGTQINESELMAHLDVSRSPIREALRVLEGEGLVERIPQRGVFVKQVTYKRIYESYTIRANLEALAAELAAVNITEEKLQQLERLIKEMRKCVEKKETREWSMQNYEFHKIIIKSSGNELLESLLKSIKVHERWIWINHADLLTDEDYYSYEKEHVNLLTALRQKNAKLSYKIAKEHILNARDKMCSNFLNDKMGMEEEVSGSTSR
ncbi:MAG: hypothetical protein DRG83_22030 [Deltaproteobacteria bacterium]|nr:MAG: hypothetical protein DRG83_22030 [Deltaproteobacteria bacterium]